MKILSTRVPHSVQNRQFSQKLKNFLSLILISSQNLVNAGDCTGLSRGFDDAVLRYGVNSGRLVFDFVMKLNNF